MAPVTTKEGSLLDVEPWRLSKSSHSHEVECYEGCEQCDAKVIYENNHVQSPGKFIFRSKDNLETWTNISVIYQNNHLLSSDRYILFVTHKVIYEFM